MADSPKHTDTLGKVPRKFVVEHIETTMKSNRPSRENTAESGTSTPRRRFVPQLEETTVKSNRKGDKGSSSGSQPSTPSEPSDRSKPRFIPQLIETTTRSRKSGDTRPALKHTDKTDLSPGDQIHLPRHMRLRPNPMPVAPKNTPVGSTNELLQQSDESRFSSSNLSKQITRTPSFQTPRLDPINSLPESDESSNVPSLSTSPSAHDSEPSELNKRSLRLRESCDDRFSGYLLALAARVAEQQLKEQAMAAYPNEHAHEPIEHFAVDNESEDSDGEIGYGMLQEDHISPHKSHRESAAGWDFVEMRKHQAKLDQQRKEQKEAAKAEQLRTKVQSPLDDHLAGKKGVASKNVLNQNINTGQKQQRAELKQMREAASPPMLGGDIKFPSCPSPKTTKIDATQKPRCRQISQSAESHESTCSERSGLWTPVGGSPTATRKNSDSGLWHGVCVAEDESHDRLSVPGQLFQTGLMTPAFQRTAIQTPAIENSDPFAHFGSRQLPPSPSDDNFRISGIDDVLQAESSLDEDYPDAFITQVYNYLSLGYPALARRYDTELCKISRLAVEDIRRDDARKNTKGYVDAPEGVGVDENDVKDCCGRWRALKLYVKEWGRQESRMAGGGPSGMWGGSGEVARRGSWGI